MARSGINKALVKQARDILLSKGENPSIDRVRIELGNTGSKATIHRYLKEIAEEEGTRLDDQALLSETLKDMISALAVRLRDEGKAIVEESQMRHQTEKLAWEARFEKQATTLREANRRADELESQLLESQQAFNILSENHHSTSTDLQRLTQQLEDLQTLIAEKDERIQSLEDKHRHSRESLEHYRDSTKDQREQDQRRHEQQIQQLQSEQRMLTQRLSEKQNDITELNEDNARLATQLNETRKSLNAAQSKIEDYENRLTASEYSAATLADKVKEQQSKISESTKTTAALEGQLTVSEKERHALEVLVATLRSELEIKNQIFEKIGTEG